MAKLELLSRTQYDANGVQTVWDFNFAGGYILPEHVKAYYELASIRTPVPVTPAMLIGANQLRITPAVPAGAVLTIYRDTPKNAPLVDFVDRGTVSEVALDTIAKQAVFVAAESSDSAATAATDVAVNAAASAQSSALSSSVNAALAAASALAAVGSAAGAAGAATAAVNAHKAELTTGSGAGQVGSVAAGPSATPTNVNTRLNQANVSVFDYMTPADRAAAPGTVDLTYAFQLAVNRLQTISAGYASPFVTVTVPDGPVLLSAPSGVEVAYDFDVMQLCFESKGGTVLIGTGSNFAFKFDTSGDPAGGGFRNIFKKIRFKGFGNAVRWHTNNRDQCSLKFVECESDENDVFLDTVSYAGSRSSLVKFESFICSNTRVLAKHYTDQLSISDAWVYAKEGSYDALLELHGDGNVSLSDTFLIPHATPLTTPANARWIDFIEDGTTTDRSLKTLTVKNVRHSLEGARPFLWTYAAVKPSGSNQISSITIEDSYFGGTGGNPVVVYKTGYPGSVSLRNTKVLSSPQIVAIAAGNTTGPVSSVPGAIANHVIMIDEATRLTQANSNNTASIIDPALEPFCYDTTTQTSKYKRSIKRNVDYRLRATAAGAGRVKATLPVYFDSENSVSSRDILSFLVVTVSDAGGPSFSNPAYRSQAVTLVSVIGGNSGSTLKRLVATPLQDASGGISFGYANSVSVFWGTGDTGSADIAANSTGGTEDSITVTWASTTPDVSWAYIVPLAGIRDNQPDRMQYGVW